MPTTARDCAYHPFMIAWMLAAILLVTDRVRANDDRLAATSSRVARQESVRAMPLNRLNATKRAAVQSVLRSASVYRRMPTQVIDCDPELFTFLIRNPHVITNMWEVLDMSKLRMARTVDDTYQIDDGNSTRGTIRVLATDYGAEAHHRILLYSEATYRVKPFLRPVKIRCVFLLRSGTIRETNGRHYVTAQLDSFVAIDQVGLDLLARTVHPLLGKTADHNFVETMRFVSSFSQAAKKNPAGVERLTRRLTRVSPDVRRELVDLAYGQAEATGAEPTPPAVQANLGNRRSPKK